MTIRLYDKAECPFCYRVRLCLGRLGVEHELRAHDRPEHEAEWRSLTQAQTVPVFVEGDLVLTDSWVILEYLQDRYGGLMPEPAEKRARARELTRYADNPVGRGIREVIFEKRSKPEAEWDRARIAAGTEAYLAALPALDAELGGSDAFVETYSFADAALTARFALALAYGVALPDDTPNLRRYFAARVADPFFRRASPPRVLAALD